MRSNSGLLAGHYLGLGCSVSMAALAVMILVRGGTLTSESPRLALTMTVVCLVSGLAYIVLGIKRKLRVKALADPVEPLAPVHGHAGKPEYNARRLRQMVEFQRGEIIVPQAFVDRLLYHWFDAIPFSSPMLQAKARDEFRRAFGAAVCLAALLLLSLLLFLGVVGSEPERSAGWTAVVYFYLLTVFCVAGAPASLALLAPCVLLPPVVIPLLVSGRTLPPAPPWAYVFLALGVLLPALRFGLFFYLLKTRLAVLRPQYGSSSNEVRIQHTVHPDGFFQYFASIMDRYRTAGLPNRCYAYSHRAAPGGTSGATGAFSGEAIWETHAEMQGYEGLDTSMPAWGAVALSVAGFAGLMAAAGWTTSLPAFLVAGLFVWQGGHLLASAEMFASETLFLSRLVIFDVQGTWAMTTVSAGNYYHDPYQAQSTEDKVDARVRIFSASLLTSVFAAPGNPLPFRNRPRFVTAFASDDPFLRALEVELEQRILQRTNVSNVRLPEHGGGQSSIFLRMPPGPAQGRIPGPPSN